MSKVYFIKTIDSESLIKIYKALNYELKGKVAVKISTGELGNNNYLNPNLIKPLVDLVHGTLVECNTAYEGKRYTTKDHLETVKKHGFDYVDILDSEGEIKLDYDGKHLKYNLVGKNILNYDSILMLSHFKGHPMGGFGGALKNMSIGLASTNGKINIHSAGIKKDNFWNTDQKDFIESMAEADKTIVDKFKNIVYINVVNNLSPDCDCVANPEPICMQDIGILASLDPVALDKACVDLIYNSNDPGKDKMIERIESRQGKIILEYANKINVGNIEYELEVL